MTTTEKPVLAATMWPTNARLIEAVARLGWLRSEWLTLDPTYGQGNWWERWRPETLVTRTRKEDGSDFTAMPEDDETYDAVAYDPPYVAPGGRKTSGMKQMHENYGMDDTPKNPALLQDLINAGLDECWRVVKPRSRPIIGADPEGGITLVKCQNYVWSGMLWLGAHKTMEHAIGLGFEVVDEFIHVGKAPRPQPERTRRCVRRHDPLTDGETCDSCDGTGRVKSRQHHARRNLSNLIVLQKPRAPRRARSGETLL